MTMTRPPIRVAIVADLPEEGWPSMDLVAEMLLTHLGPAVGVTPLRIQPPFVPRLGRFLRASSAPPVLDRLINRFHDYPKWLRAAAPDVDIYHIVDHSYAHLAHVLPAGRTVVTCHDIDAFRPLLGRQASESRLPLALVRRLATGIARASVVACVSDSTRRELVATGLVAEHRTEVVFNGVHHSCSPHEDAEADAEAARLLGPVADVEILHVGSTIARKRIDILLQAFGGVAGAVHGARLVRVGGAFTAAQADALAALGLSGRVVTLPALDRRTLAAVYRRATLLLLPSEREGFGLPIVESMACGTPVLAADLPVLREIGGAAAAYAPVANVPAWRDAVLALLEERRTRRDRWHARRQAGLARAAAFSWQRGAGQMAAIYSRVAGRVAA